MFLVGGGIPCLPRPRRHRTGARIKASPNEQRQIAEEIDQRCNYEEKQKRSSRIRCAPGCGIAKRRGEIAKKRSAGSSSLRIGHGEVLHRFAVIVPGWRLPTAVTSKLII